MTKIPLIHNSTLPSEKMSHIFVNPCQLQNLGFIGKVIVQPIKGSSFHAGRISFWHMIYDIQTSEERKTSMVLVFVMHGDHSHLAGYI